MKKYNLTDIPQRDKNYLLPVNDRVKFVKHLPQLLKNNAHDHDISFSTFTFENTKFQAKYRHYEEFFSFFMMRLNNSLLNRKQTHISPSLIAFPELSFHCVVPKQHECLHFHGFLMIDKRTAEKFSRKCAENTLAKIIDEVPDNSIVLKERFLNPYPKSIKENYLEPKLKVRDYKIYPIHDIDAHFRTALYSGKKFHESSFDYDHLIIQSKLSNIYK